MPAKEANSHRGVVAVRSGRLNQDQPGGRFRATIPKKIPDFSCGLLSTMRRTGPKPFRPFAGFLDFSSPDLARSFSTTGRSDATRLERGPSAGRRKEIGRAAVVERLVHRPPLPG